MSERFQLLSIIVIATLIVAVLLGLTVGVLWLGWIGGWYGVSAVVFANFIGSTQGLFKGKR